MSSVWTSVVKELMQPRQRLSVSQWAGENRVIPRGTSPEPGRWRNERVPYLVEPMDAFSDVTVETVVCMMSSQVGKTECLLNVIGYYADHEPSPILVVQPNEMMQNAFSKERITPTFQQSPALKNKLEETDNRTSSSARKTGNTMQIKHFPGGFLAFASSYAPAGLATRPIRIVLLDEVDRYGSTREGNPIRLSIQRSENFYNRKIGAFSSPTIEGESNIEAWFNRSDQRYYHVPCPHCGVFHVLEWKNVQWKKDRPETATLVCPHCEGIIRERERNDIITQGAWIPENPDSNIRGYQISALYSPWSRFASLAQEWSNAVHSGNREDMMAFVNLKLGLPWKSIALSTQESEILEARTELEPHTVPEEAIALTAGIDRQKWGFWFVVRAWARDFSSWLIHYGFLPSWEDLEALLFDSAYPVQGGAQTLSPWRAALDIGGGQTDGGPSMTEEAYWWLRRNGQGRGCRVWGVQGASHRRVEKIWPSPTLDRTPSGKRIPGGLQIVNLDTAELKEDYHHRLERAREGDQVQAAYLNAQVGEDYAKQIKSEEKRVDSKGRVQWVQVGRENHLFDCEVYCHATVDPQWPTGGLQLKKGPPAASGGSKQGPARKKKKAGGPKKGAAKPSWFRR